MSVIEELQQEQAPANEPIETSPESPNPSADPAGDTPTASTEQQTPEEPSANPANEQPIDNGSDTPTNADAEPSKEPETPPTPSFASEEVAKYNEFVRVTGKEDYNAFKFWDTPTNEINEEDLLKKYLSEKEGMTEKEVNYELKRMEVNEEDFGDFEDEETSEQEILRERTLRKAKEWHSSEFDKISKAKENAVNQLPERLTAEEFTKRAMEQQHSVYQENVNKVYETLPTITEIPLKVAGDESKGLSALDVSFTPDEQFASDMKTVSEDIGVVVNQFYDENAKLKNPKGWIENAIWAYHATRNKMIQFMIEQAVLNDRTSRNQSRRNVTPDTSQSVSVSGNSSDAFDEWFNSRN